jgi:hypothetical protein
MKFTNLELITIERALEVAARQYECDEHSHSCIPGHGWIAVNFKDCKRDAQRLAKRIRQATEEDE